MNDVRSWLISSRDYDDGVSLLEKHVGDTFIVRMLKRSRTEFNELKLSEELAAISDKTDVVIQEKQELKATGIWRGNDLEEQPVIIQDLVVQAKEIHKDVATMHAQLALLNTQALKIVDSGKRNAFLKENSYAILVHSMLDLDDIRVEKLRQITHFEIHGTIPDALKPLDQAILELSEGEIRAELLRLRPQISKHKDRTERAADVIKWQDRVKILERRLDELV